MAELADVTVAPPLPNPPWVRWDHADSPGYRRRSSSSITGTRASCPRTLLRQRSGLAGGYWPPACRACWATPTSRRRTCDGTAGRWAVHDWDSLAWQPEAALAGAASGSFASAGPPTLAPIESSAAFLVAYQTIRGRLFTAAEQEIAWAASLWMAAYNAREEALARRHLGGPRRAPRPGRRTPPPGQCLDGVIRQPGGIERPDRQGDGGHPAAARRCAAGVRGDETRPGSCFTGRSAVMSSSASTRGTRCTANSGKRSGRRSPECG